jgi:HK97 family phage prohead protease
MFHRVRALSDAEQLGAEGQINLIASTDKPVDWGSWREVLKHDGQSIDMRAARSLLINHKPDQLAGSISGMQVVNGELRSAADIDEDAKMQSGVSVRKAVKKRQLGGVSIGYSYDMKDTAFNEETRELTVNKWRLLEISLTPIPADSRAHVRSMPTETTAALPAATKERTTVMPEVITPQVTPVVPPVDHAALIRELAESKEREAKAVRTLKLQTLAAEQGIDTAGIDLGSFASEAEGLTELIKRKAKPTEIKPGNTPVHTNIDAADKARDAALGAMAFNAGFKGRKDQEGNPLVGKSMRNIIRQTAQMLGENTGNWDETDIAWYGLGRNEKIQGTRSGPANVTTSNFSTFVFLNNITKILAMGYERGAASSQYKKICSFQTVPDFKTYNIGALGAGNLTNTVEDTAFPELTKTDGVYSNTAKMWGGTLSLTIQALKNDDLGQFNRVLSQAGGLLDKTMDRRVFQKLLMGTSSAEGTSTWTSNTTSGGSLVYTTQDLMAAARGKLGLVRTALQVKTGLDGNPTGNIPRFLICGPTREMEARAITGDNGPGLQAGVAQPSATMTVIPTAWLEASALTGNSTTSYYLLCDPADVTGLVVSTVQGMEGIQVEQYDAGAVAAIKYKLWSPFEADLHFISISSTNTIAAAQQGTT